MQQKRAILYVRNGCHLCEDAQAMLRHIDCPVTLSDVDADADLQRLYGELVPVLVVDGETVASGIFREPDLRKALVGLRT